MLSPGSGIRWSCPLCRRTAKDQIRRECRERGLPEPVTGPLALGFACHFGLGMFTAVSETE
jgi:hypothetical protein